MGARHRRALSMAPHLDASDLEVHLRWPEVMQAIRDGHDTAPPQVDDTLIRRGDDSLLSRSAWIDGLGSLVKTALVFPDNGARQIPTVHGAVALFSDRTGELDATIDFHLLTRWKTAADSALAASLLARPTSRRILIVGSGTIATAMIEVYRSVFPDARFTIWSRTSASSQRLAALSGGIAVTDLESAVRDADVISAATMSLEPLIRGQWLRAGQHIDLIGGYRPDMREADDETIRRASVFVDSASTASDVGDVCQPLASGILHRSDITDFAALAHGGFARSGDDEITVFKNAGGAHLDLMVARHMFEQATSAESSR